MTVFIVDDEAYIRESLLELVRWKDIGVDTVKAFPGALSALEEASACTPDVIISDIRMPDMDGLEFAAKVARICPSTRFVILTGYPDFSYARTALRNGVIRYLVKPVSPAVIESTVAELSHGHDEEPAVKSISCLVRGYISQYLGSASLNEAASSLGMSPNHVAAAVRKETGMTFSQILHEERMRRASEMIRNGSSRNEAMAAIGYSDPKSFRRAFSEYEEGRV